MISEIQENLAAIDIGTNSFHLIVVRLKKNGNFEIIDREKETIRLGEGYTGDIKEIRPESISRAIVCLKRFKEIADAHNAKIKAVATSAVRESLNKNEFIKAVLEHTGIEVEVVSGIEEARLIYLGILKAVPVYNKKTLCIDIGGGSTELTIGKEGKILHSISLKLGAVRITQQFFPDFITSPSQIEEAEKWVEGILFPVLRKLKDTDVEVVVGSSGTIMSTALMIQALKGKKRLNDTILNNVKFSVKELKKIKKEIFEKSSFEDRLTIDGIDPSRADIITAGVIILSKIFEYFNVEEMTVSGYALREGILIDYLNEINPDSEKPNLHQIRFDSVRHLAELCNYDRGHCAYVSKIALSIFDQMIKKIAIDPKTREYLEAAALLHDIGYHIAHNNHHRHSQYIIRNSELLGFNEREINIIANVARYHRKSHPKNKHKEFAELNEKDQLLVMQLAGILRIADALDRTHKKLIKGVDLRFRDTKVYFSMIPRNKYPEIEIWNFERRKALFEEAFLVEAVSEVKY